MKLLDTIAAVSTPPGKGGVALIRISGADAVAVGERVFAPHCGRPLSEMAVGKMSYGSIWMTQNGERRQLDDGMAAVFRAPHSFTGEDTVEITCHGGVLITREVLSAVLAAGARHAEAGEFTRRAFLSGKLRLTEAEALGKLLEAKTQEQMALARSGMEGRLSSRLEELYGELRRVMSSVYATIDFPEEDLAELSREEMAAALRQVLEQIRALCATYRTGRAVNEGISTVICGRTNAGKSSVYNRILGYDAAIVTDVEGTTRDLLRQTASLGRVTLQLCDTAGFRETEDPVESIGIQRGLQAMKEAELILAVFDGSVPPTEEDRRLAEQVAETGIPSIGIWNKSDLGGDPIPRAEASCFSQNVILSAKEGTGFDVLCQRVEEMFCDGTLNLREDAVVADARQQAALLRSEEALASALADLEAGLPPDLCCVGIECAMSALGEVDGREIGEEIVAEIFSRFCVGK